MRFIVLFFLMCPVLGFPWKSLEIVYIEDLAEQKVGSIIIEQIYNDLGIPVRVYGVPAKRAEAFLKSGEIDGEIMRIYDYGEINKDKLRIPTPYYTVKTTGFKRKDAEIRVDGVAELHKYRLAQVLGIKHTEILTKGAPSVRSLSSSRQVLRFVDAKRADIGLTSAFDGDYSIVELGLENMEKMDIVFAQYPLFHYLHERHAALVPKVDSYIKKISLDGTLQRYIEEAEATVLRAGL